MSDAIKTCLVFFFSIDVIKVLRVKMMISLLMNQSPNNSLIQQLSWKKLETVQWERCFAAATICYSLFLQPLYHISHYGVAQRSVNEHCIMGRFSGTRHSQ